MARSEDAFARFVVSHGRLVEVELEGCEHALLAPGNLLRGWVCAWPAEGYGQTADVSGELCIEDPDVMPRCYQRMLPLEDVAKSSVCQTTLVPLVRE